jgi:YggT family protein
MSGPFSNAAIFLVNTLFDLYVFILGIRIILVWSRVNYFNPVSQFIVKLTGFIITPIRRILPNVLHIELATLLFMFIIEMVKFALIGFVSLGTPQIEGLIILAIADMLKTILTIFFYAILLQAVLSWIRPGPSPLNELLTQMTNRILRPIQRVIPPVGGFDISPIPALIGFQLLIILVVTPLFTLGLRLAFG